MKIKIHLSALLLGTVLDYFIGDPHWIIHPVKAIGGLVSFLEKRLLGNDLSPKRKKTRGLFLVVTVLIFVILTTLLLEYICFRTGLWAGFIFESIISCYCLSLRSLIEESNKVSLELKKGGLERARKSLSMIVGRDTENLSEEKLFDAAIETVAENSSDGVMAPFLYLLIGGPVFGLFYKAVNTMDSMIGYHNDRYEDFGYFAARLDDIFNLLPSRLTGLFIILLSFKTLGFDRKNAWKIFIRDRFKHQSPNSAQAESAFSGALGLRLGGDAFYSGKIVERPYIGDEKKPVDEMDLQRAHMLLYLLGFSLQIILLVMIAIV